MNKNITFKKLSKQQIIISIDRLTRFKATEEKYLRVLSDIVTSSLKEPKIKKSELLNMDYSEIKSMAEEIFNSSLSEHSEDWRINEYLRFYENSLFINNDSVQKLLDNRLDYISALKLIENENIPLNLRFLNSLAKNPKKAVQNRIKGEWLYPVEKVVIAEGITEEILLPVFANLNGYNFLANGVKVIGAGGKNQVVKLYYKLSEELKLPIFVLLDKDAESNRKSITSKLRKNDKIHLIQGGEFEDILSKDLIVKTINSEFKNFVHIKKSELNTGDSMVKTLEELFKDRCLHEFKKAEFAQRVKERIHSEKDLTEEIIEIIKEIEIL